MIEGNAPYLLLSDGTKLKNLDSLLGFSMPKQNGRAGSESINTSQTKALTAPLGMTFNDIKALVEVDGKNHSLPSNYQQDDDGDEYMPSGTITATWRDYKNNVITDLTQPLLAYAAPYTLTITINNLKAQTKYGIPSSTHYGSLAKTYTFTSTNQGIQYIKPLSMQVYTGRAGVDIKFAQGYNPDVWDAGQGFSVKKMRTTSKQFPTTGFDKAVFDLIGAGNDQSKYRCSKKGSWVELSGSASKNLGANCRVTYNHSSKAGKPQTTVTIDMEYKKTDGTWARIDSYTIPVPTKWAIGMGNLAYRKWYLRRNNYYALNACRRVGKHADSGLTDDHHGSGISEYHRQWRQKYMYRRNELSNAPQADPIKYPEGSVVMGGLYSRDVDSTFTGEWGLFTKYPGSAWIGSGFEDVWVAEVYSFSEERAWGQTTVYSHGGIFNGYWGDPESPLMVICRGE